MIKVVYVEDEIGDQTSRRVQQRLHIPDDFQCDIIYPKNDLADFPMEYDAYLLDLDLGVKHDDQQVNYHGSTLAAEIRLRRLK